MNNQRLTALLIGAGIGSLATLIGIFISMSLTVAATLPTWLAIGLTVGATLISVIIGAAIVAVATSFLMHATGDLTNDVADAITQ
jgi:hypothetical protein